MDKNEWDRQSEMSKYFGPRELFRIAGFLMGWIFTGVIVTIILSVVFHIREDISTAVFIVFVITALAFPIMARFWQPANGLLNKVIGNKNFEVRTVDLPSVRSSLNKRPWYYYLPSLWGGLLLIVLLYFLINYLTK